MVKDSRVSIYRLLTDCYFPPDEKLIQRFKSIAGSTDWPSFELVKVAPKKNELKSLVIDFSRLFVGPFKLLAPPYGSLYLETQGVLMGDSTLDVRTRYRKEGLEISLKEVPDHIVLELEFMYFLISKQIEAENSSNNQAASDYLKKQASFLQTHLVSWIAKFAHNVQIHAQTNFYRKLASITMTFVKRDLENLLIIQE